MVARVATAGRAVTGTGVTVSMAGQEPQAALLMPGALSETNTDLGTIIEERAYSQVSLYPSNGTIYSQSGAGGSGNTGGNGGAGVTGGAAGTGGAGANGGIAYDGGIIGLDTGSIWNVTYTTSTLTVIGGQGGVGGVGGVGGTNISGAGAGIQGGGGGTGGNSGAIYAGGLAGDNEGTIYNSDVKAGL